LKVTEQRGARIAPLSFFGSDKKLLSVVFECDRRLRMG
jgi:hypothetical protein